LHQTALKIVTARKCFAPEGLSPDDDISLAIATVTRPASKEALTSHQVKSDNPAFLEINSNILLSLPYCSA
jgi:hypothetical protein